MPATIAQPTASQTGRRFFKKYSLEKPHLATDGRRLEARAVELGTGARRAVAVEPEPAAGDVEALRDQLGVVAGAAHACAEPRIVVLAAAQVVYDAHDVVGALRIVLREPFLEQVLELVRQPHDD